jgi:hypothetical protein
MSRLVSLLAQGAHARHQFGGSEVILGVQLLSRLAAAGCLVEQLWLAADVESRAVVQMLISRSGWYAPTRLISQDGLKLEMTASTRGLAQMILDLFDWPATGGSDPSSSSSSSPGPRSRAAADGHCTVLEAQRVQANFNTYLAARRRHQDDDADVSLAQRAVVVLGRFIDDLTWREYVQQ